MNRHVTEVNTSTDNSRQAAVREGWLMEINSTSDEIILMPGLIPRPWGSDQCALYAASWQLIDRFTPAALAEGGADRCIAATLLVAAGVKIPLSMPKERKTNDAGLNLAFCMLNQR